MSDKSFGDHMSRGQVKNPLLSTAVIGLSIEDLTQNAVLLPVSRTQELFGRQDQIGPQIQTLASDFTPNIPSGDANFAPIKPEYITQQNAKNCKTPENAKTDDFDVNEYFARLQGTRYVSAPINSHIEDANANLEAKEQNLEEINLNEPDKQMPEEFQQSLTADIAQNLSQLPAVLPQVASAVFSSFSNMLSMKREQTPEERPQQLRVDEGVPLMGVSEVKEVAPPPKEPPVCGPGNFRITTKKKAYAQIPGLSSRDSVQMQTNTPALTHQPIFTPNVQNNDFNVGNTPQTNLDFDVFNNTVQNNPVDTTDTVNVFEGIGSESKSLATSQFNQDFNPQAPIIPPPPMFSNLAKRDSLPNTAKAVLPPSVARRKATSNTQATFTNYENIFVPAPITSENSQILAPTTPQCAQPILAQTETLPTLSFPSNYASQGLQPEPFIPAVADTSMTMSSVEIPSPSGSLNPPIIAPFTSGHPAHVPSNLPPLPTNMFTPSPDVSSTNAAASMTPVQLSSELAPPPIFISSSKTLPPPPTFAPENQVSAKNIFTPATVSSASGNVSSAISMPPAVSNTPQVFNPYPKEESAGLKIELSTQNIPSLPSATDNVPQMVNPSELRAHCSILHPDYHAPPIDTQLPEPPKALGNTSFRMAKKRPQYYSGPIEGIGAISNNQKPFMAPVASAAFQGAVFTPEKVMDDTVPSAFQGAIFTPETVTSEENNAVPTHQGAMFTPEAKLETNFKQPDVFSADKQAETTTYIPFSVVNAPEIPAYNLDYNTAFDMSRQTTDSYEPPKQDSAFGIIGSLKSKLSSLDINKIQSSVTTFFDPGYNVAKPDTARENEAPAHGQSQSGIEIFVPNAGTHAQPYSYDYHQANFTYGQGAVPNPTEYYQQQVHNVYSSESYYSEPHYGTKNYSPNFEDQRSYVQNFYAPPSYITIGNVPDSKENADSYSASLPSAQVSETPHNKDDNGDSGVNLHFSNPGTSFVDSFNSVHSNLPQNLPKNYEHAEVRQLQHSVETGGMKDQTERTPQINLAVRGDNSGEVLSKPINTADLTSPFNEDCALNIEKSFGKTNYPNYFSMYERYDTGKQIEKSMVERTDSSNDEISTPLYKLASTISLNPIDDGVDELDEQDEISWNSNEEECDDQSIAANLTALALSDSADDEFPINDSGQSSDLNICETCREVTKPEEKDADLTSQLIENITSPIQLLNPVEVPLPESDSDLPIDFDPMNQCAEISLIADRTVETLQVQSASELLDGEESRDIEHRYAWCTEASFPDHMCQGNLAHTFIPDPKAAAYFVSNNLFFDHIPNNASDEIKAEFIVSQDETPFIARQLSIPTAPPAEDLDDAKSDETSVLDVQSIEQDASNDFPVFEEFVIEPSETDDDKLEVRDKSDEGKDTFTNRVDRFKKLESSDDLTEHKNFNVTNSNTIMPSYFDTGNYAVDTHYKNSLTSPASIKSSETNIPFCVPPGFENNFDQPPQEINKKGEPELPDTSTQTRITTTVTYSTVQTNIDTTTTIAKTASVFQESNPIVTHKLPDFPSIFGAKVNLSENISSISSKDNVDSEAVEPACSKSAFEKVENKIQEKKIPLPDPINFFASTTEEVKTSDGVNRLASYFASPVKTDDKKPFFELSQGQDHYRQNYENESHNANTSKIFFDVSQSQDHHKDISNIPHDKYLANLNLMKDLTSVQNIEPVKEQVVRTVNYFTIEYDDVNLNKGEPTMKEHEKTDLNVSKEKNEVEESIFDNDDTLTQIINKCKICCDFNTDHVVFRETDFGNLGKVNFKQAMDGGSGKVKEGSYAQQEEKGEKSVNLKMEDVIPDGDNNDGVAMMSENRTSSEYEPVKHHWFYRVDMEDKSTWRGFSSNDSNALEDAFHSPDLTDNTLVATDGGRFDVNVVGRLRIAVYWNDKPTNVRRCSWFYKGTTDARYVPYTEPVAEKLELQKKYTNETDRIVRTCESVPTQHVLAVHPALVSRWDRSASEYTDSNTPTHKDEFRHGVTTGEWHRRLVLPNNEMVVMHGPAVMVHFLQASTADNFGAPNLFTFGKRVYRNPPKFKVPQDVPVKVDHLLLLVHGAGEWRNQKEKIQSTMRPRVVRRGFDESEIEDPEPSSIDHLLMLCHGVGSACDMRFRSVEEVVDDFRSTSLQLLQSHYRNSYESGLVGRVEVLPISWHASLHAGPRGVDRRLACVTLQSIPRLRNFTNDTVLDVLFYTSPHYCQMILNTVCGELNRVYSLFMERNPSFQGGVSLGGHSLGSVILYDLLCHQELPPLQGHFEKPEKTYLFGTEAKNPTMSYPKLQFEPLSFYALGSPIAIFECIRGVESLGSDFFLPTCRNFFNIFHPYDPIAYRIEPLINQQLQHVKPLLIPHHKGRKRMHLELKDTMARVGADLKQRLVESIRNTWSSMWAPAPPPPHQLEKVVEEEMEKEQLEDEASKDDTIQQVDVAPAELLGRLNGGRRVDHVLQEAPFEMINEYLFAMSSHVCYWESEDTMLLILREIYDSMGVQADICVPQNGMTVHRTRNDEAGAVKRGGDSPSTSHSS